MNKLIREIVSSAATVTRVCSLGNIVVLLESVEHLKTQLSLPPLCLDIEQAGRLLSDERREALQKKFYDDLRQEQSQLTRKIVEQEREEWYKNVEPEANINGHYHTNISAFVFEMVQAHIDMVKLLGLDMSINVVCMCLTTMSEMMVSYRAEIRKYSMGVFQATAAERETFSFCIPNLMACINNCSILSDELDQLKGIVLERVIFYLLMLYRQLG